MEDHSSIIRTKRRQTLRTWRWNGN
jgi:hypothetical protein